MFLIGSKCDQKFLQQEYRDGGMIWKTSPFAAKRFTEEEANRRVNDWNGQPEGNYFIIDERNVSVEGKRITEDDREEKIERIEAIVGTLTEMPWHDVPGPELTRLHDHISRCQAQLESVEGYARSRKRDTKNSDVYEEMSVILSLVGIDKE